MIRHLRGRAMAALPSPAATRGRSLRDGVESRQEKRGHFDPLKPAPLPQSGRSGPSSMKKGGEPAAGAPLRPIHRRGKLWGLEQVAREPFRRSVPASRGQERRASSAGCGVPGLGGSVPVPLAPSRGRRLNRVSLVLPGDEMRDLEIVPDSLLHPSSDRPTFIDRLANSLTKRKRSTPQKFVGKGISPLPLASRAERREVGGSLEPGPPSPGS